MEERRRRKTRGGVGRKKTTGPLLRGLLRRLALVLALLVRLGDHALEFSPFGVGLVRLDRLEDGAR